METFIFPSGVPCLVVVVVGMGNTTYYLMKMKDYGGIGGLGHVTVVVELLTTLIIKF